MNLPLVYMLILAVVGGWFVWALRDCIREAADAAAFARFKREVRAIWRAEVCANEDIIANTGEDCWLDAHTRGLSAREAVIGVEF